MITGRILIFLGICAINSAAIGAGNGNQAVAANEVAARLSAAHNGSSCVHLLMEIKGATGQTGSALQLLIKRRSTQAGADVLYQVLWPKDRKGEAVLLHQDPGGAIRGSVYLPPNNLRTLGPGQMGESLFGSDLSYEDAVEDVYSWKDQAAIGAEAINRVDCMILESKPPEGSIYGSVKSWIDTRRLVPLRIEKYLPSGRMARKIETTRVTNDDAGHPIPANLEVTATGSGSQTDLDGSRIRQNITYADRDFSLDGMKDLATPR